MTLRKRKPKVSSPTYSATAKCDEIRGALSMNNKLCGAHIVCFDLGFHTRNPVIKYRPDASCMSYMEARAEMP